MCGLGGGCVGGWGGVRVCLRVVGVGGGGGELEGLPQCLHIQGAGGILTLTLAIIHLVHM